MRASSHCEPYLSTNTIAIDLRLVKMRSGQSVAGVSCCRKRCRFGRALDGQAGQLAEMISETKVRRPQAPAPLFSPTPAHTPSSPLIFRAAQQDAYQVRTSLLCCVRTITNNFTATSSCSADRAKWSALPVVTHLPNYIG
jgi:hypothetical protein